MKQFLILISIVGLFSFTKSIGFVGTEMWLKSSYPVKSIKELMRLTEEFEEGI